MIDLMEDDYLLVKIIDWGLACSIPNDGYITEDNVGSPAFMAPEVIKGLYNEKCDIWGCGVILYELLSGRLPFDPERYAKIYQDIE